MRNSLTLYPTTCISSPLQTKFMERAHQKNLLLFTAKLNQLMLVTEFQMCLGSMIHIITCSFYYAV